MRELRVWQLPNGLDDSTRLTVEGVLRSCGGKEIVLREEQYRSGFCGLSQDYDRTRLVTSWERVEVEE